MCSYITELVTWCLLGVGGTFLLLIVGTGLSKERSPLWDRHSFSVSAVIISIWRLLAACSQCPQF